MKLIFDLWQSQPISGSKFHGGGEYIKAVYKRLIEKFASKHEIIVFYDSNLFIDNWILESFKVNSIQTVLVQSIEDVQKLLLDHRDADVFYSGLPYLYGRISIPSGMSFYGTVHGLRAYELPCDKYSHKYFSGIRSLKFRVKWFLKKRLKKQAYKQYKECIRNLDKVICVSKHTEYAIKCVYPELHEKTIVFYTPQKVEEPPKIDEDTSLPKKFILMISCNRFEKNSCRAVQALDYLLENNMLNEYKIVTTGNLPQKVLKNVRNKSNFIHYDYVSTSQLERLYKQCDIFLYPTLNEGFGMPPLEAMKYGKTCIVSGVCSLPEVCGDAALFCNPYDVEEIQNRILNATENKLSEEKVRFRYEKIRKKQVSDLDDLCEYLVSMNKEYKNA